jgi:hypothetical protein
MDLLYNWALASGQILQEIFCSVLLRLHLTKNMLWLNLLIVEECAGDIPSLCGQELPAERNCSQAHG